MKNKGNKLLAVALLGLSVMLVGCGEDKKELTSEQKTALTAANNTIIIGFDK